MNPLDKNHKDSDVEIFEVPSRPFKDDVVQYSHYKSSPHYVDFGKGPSQNEFNINPTNPKAQFSSPNAVNNNYPRVKQNYHKKVEDRYQDYPPQTGFEIPKVGPGQNFPEHVFTIPDDTENLKNPYSRQNDYDNYDFERRENNENENNVAARARNEINYQSDRLNYKRETSDYEYSNYNDLSDYNSYNDDYNEVDYSLPPAIPAPLPPPPAIIEMQHDSIFSGNFDVPKLGVETEYKPPELVYNEMYLHKDTRDSNSYPDNARDRHSYKENVRDRNSFSNLLPKQSFPEKQSRSLAATPSPFLPTPSKVKRPLADYSHLYKQKKSSFVKSQDFSKPSYSPGSEYSKKSNYFKPQRSPSLTFEPDVSNEIDAEGRKLYEKLHGGNSYDDSFINKIVENNLGRVRDGNLKIENVNLWKDP